MQILKTMHADDLTLHLRPEKIIPGFVRMKTPELCASRAGDLIDGAQIRDEIRGGGSLLK